MAITKDARALGRSRPSVGLRQSQPRAQAPSRGEPNTRALDDFWQTAKQRVSVRLTEDPDQRSVPLGSWIKFTFQIGVIGAAVMALLWVVRDPTLVILLYGVAAFPLLGLVLGFGHDACHGSASKRIWINSTVLNLSFLAHGADPELQKIRHVGSHYRFPAQHGRDAEYALVKFIRIFPSQPVRKIHRLQHWYAWFLYLVGTPFVVWIWEFVQLVRGQVDGFGAFNRDPSFMVRFLLRKTAHVVLWIALPITVAAHSAWIVLIGYAAMQGIFSLVFLSISVGTHLHAAARFPASGPEPPVRGSAAWVDEQISSSVNIAARSRLVRWFLGSIATHAAHHLFPGVPHGRIEPIRQAVDRAAKENRVPLIETSLLGVLVGHWRYLKALSSAANAEPPTDTTAASCVGPPAQSVKQHPGNCDRDFLALCEMTARDFWNHLGVCATGSFWHVFEQHYAQLSRAAISCQDRHPSARWRRYQHLRRNDAPPLRRLLCLQAAVKAHILDDLPIAICAAYGHCQERNEPVAAPDRLRRIFLDPDTTQTLRRVDRHIRIYLASEFSDTAAGRNLWMLAIYVGQQMPFGMNAKKTQDLRRQAWQNAIDILQADSEKHETARP